jgi:hypothetical protein
MKVKIICLLLPLFLLGCSKKATEAGSSRAAEQNMQPGAGLPFKVTVVETPETKEIKDIKSQAKDLLAAGDYEKLEALAKKFRDSKECYADGSWKLYDVYSGLDFEEDAPEADWAQHFAALRSWLKARPDSMTARVTMAENLASFAWKARGGDYGDKVSAESFKLFFQRLTEARNVLTSAKSLKEQCPFWWSVLLQAELGLQTERAQYDSTFNAAIKAWPDYTALYYRRAYFLLPRWYGTEGEWESDLQKSADKIGGEEGDMLYARVVWDMHQFVYSTNIFKEYKLSWDRVNAGLGVIEKRFPDSLAVKNEGARLAVLARDQSAAKKYFDETQGQMDTDCWQSEDDFVRFANMVYGVSQ